MARAAEAASSSEEESSDEEEEVAPAKKPAATKKVSCKVDWLCCLQSLCLLPCERSEIAVTKARILLCLTS